MFRHALKAAVLLAGAVLLPGTAHAASGYIVGRVEMRAGPDYDYPIVQLIRDGRRVDIYGCLNDWSWCDVGYRADRGWVDGGHLVADYQGRRQTIVTVAPLLGFGILSFSFGDYWEHHYRSRPFYAERNRWENQYYDHFKPSWGQRPERRGSNQDRAGDRARQVDHNPRSQGQMHQYLQQDQTRQQGQVRQQTQQDQSRRQDQVPQQTQQDQSRQQDQKRQQGQGQQQGHQEQNRQDHSPKSQPKQEKSQDNQDGNNQRGH